MRFVCINASTASISRSRPMKEVSCPGRFASAASADRSGCLVQGQIGVTKLMHPLRSLDVLQAVHSHVVEPRAAGKRVDDEVAGRL